ncbi:MAG: TolC family protein [Bacteroidetes bacterium]|nr:TolC family protein [Bacteroidota bacterium]
MKTKSMNPERRQIGSHVRMQSSPRRAIFVYLVMVLSVMALPVVAQEGPESFVANATENNPALRVAQARYEAARLQAPQAAALPDLKIGAGYFAVPVETRLGPQVATLSVSQSFPWFGTLGAEEEAAGARARQAQAELRDARNRLAADVRAVWYRMFVLERSIARSREQLAFLSTVRELARVRYEAGKTGYTDVLRLQMEAEELETRIQTLEDSREALRTQMEQLVNAPVSSPGVFPDVLPPMPMLPAEDALRERMLAHNPLLQRLDDEGAYWNHRSDAARLMGYPMFTVGVTYTAIDPRTDMVVDGSGRDAILPQIGISIPLFGSRYSAMEEQAEQQGIAARQSRDDMRNRLLVQLEERLRDYRDALRRRDLNQRLTGIAEQTREVGLQEYSTGMKNLEDLLVIERSLLRYALAGEQAEADLRTTYDVIMYLTAEE